MINTYSFITTRENSSSSYSYPAGAEILIIEERQDRLRLRKSRISTVKGTLSTAQQFHTLSFTSGKVRVYESRLTSGSEKATTATPTKLQSLFDFLPSTPGYGTLAVPSYSYYVKPQPTDKYNSNNSYYITYLLVQMALANNIIPTFPHQHYIDQTEPPKFPHRPNPSYYTTREPDVCINPYTTLVMLAHPVLGLIATNTNAYIEVPKYTPLTNCVFSGLKRDTIEEFVDVVFPGKSTRMTRRLVIEALFPGSLWDTSALDFLDMLGDISDKLTVDHIHTLLRTRTEKRSKDNSYQNFPRNSISTDHKKGLSILAKEVSPPKLCRLLEEWIESGVQHHFLDSLNMIRQLEGKLDLGRRVRGINDLHDKVMLQNLTLTFKSKDIPLPKEVLELNGTEINGLTLMIPNKTLQLALWSSKMNNCIRSYADSAVARRVLLLGLYRGEEVVYNTSIEPSYSSALRVSQFSGPRNSYPNPQDHKAFTEWVKENTSVLSLAFGGQNR